jgi:hypothetical protein
MSVKEGGKIIQKYLARKFNIRKVEHLQNFRNQAHHTLYTESSPLDHYTREDYYALGKTS